MRLMLGMTIGMAALAGLSACGQSEEALRNSSRASLLTGCRAANAGGADRATLTA